MKYTVYALIRRRIRTLYPEPFLRTLFRDRRFQAVSATLAIYAVLLLLLARWDIRPSRRVDLYREISVTILPPVSETTQSEASAPPPAAERSPNTQTTPSVGEGIYTPNRGRGLRQIDSGDFSPPGVETEETKEEPPAGVGRIALEGASATVSEEKKPKVKSTEKEKITRETKVKEAPETRVKPEPEPEPAPEPEPIQEIVPEVVELPAERVETVKEPDKPVSPHDAKRDLSPVRTEIMPAYIIDRAPSFVEMGPKVFPEAFKDQVLEREVVLHVFLTADGRVADVEIMQSGGIEFDEAAIRTILGSTFAPARVGDLAVPCRFEITFRFTSYYAEEENE